MARPIQSSSSQSHDARARNRPWRAAPSARAEAAPEKSMTTRTPWTLAGLAAVGCAVALWPATALPAAQCARTITADVVALDQPLMFNRLGSQNVNGAMFALRRDVVDKTSGKPLAVGGTATPGFVKLRDDKRPRPLVLRVAAGDCLVVNFQNLLSPAANPNNASHPLLQRDDQVADRNASFHVSGMQLVSSIVDDGSNVGLNASSVVAPGGSAVYRLYAEREGTFLATSHGAPFGGESLSGNASQGLFAAVNVEPAGARFYRSQVTEEELRLATRGKTADGQPILDYEARYPLDCDAGGVWCKEGKAGIPVLNMLDGARLVHSDINAVVVGTGADGSFPASTYPLESVGKRNPSVPNRLEPFREFTVLFHDEMTVANAFPAFWADPVLKHTLHAVGDVFQINYGSGAIGPEIIANRLGVGPMHDCIDCSFEEFFLTSSAVGDAAMVVDVPANAGLEACGPAGGAACAAVGPKATQAFYPDDPSNVHHSYMNDFVKFRNLHSGKEHHVFHLHNHQWLFNPSDDNSNYLDAQGVGPGSGYTYEINFGGSGNRNKSAGDAIFHCHFYPHFAQGMWEMWRNHDVFEAGTPLDVSGGAAGYHSSPWALQYGRPAADARALPDGEIAAGTPIPALVPLPGKAMAPAPQAKVTVVPKISTNPATGVATTVGSNAKVERPADGSRVGNPGYPFWIAGIEHTVGHRPPTPPLDMKANPADAASGGWDGGLPRHTIDGKAAGGEAQSVQTRLDFSKEMLKAKAVWFPEDGTDLEQAAMDYHGKTRNHPSWTVRLDGSVLPASFVTNGSREGTSRPPQAGAPYHDPCVDDAGKLMTAAGGHFFDASGGLGIAGASPFNADTPRVYKGAVIQFDAVLNKAGYHYPQQRTTTLWQDAVPTILKQRPPEPWVIRNNTFDCTMYYHTNLVPKVFELDDYQIRTPTDIIGQHIHLPKWDLTTTDGSANGWNYEDGTLAPDAVVERIHAINAYNPTGAGNPSDSAGRAANTPLKPEPHPFFGQFGKAEWLGARTTIQRWFFDPVVNVQGVDRGLGIIFTHDHYGPSTHQQVGLYSTVLTEPAGSTWVHNETGVPMYTRPDGGPTSWQAAILTGDIDGDGQNDSFREFYFEYADFQHAYEPGVYVGVGQYGGYAPPPDVNSFRKAVNPSVRVQANPVLPDLRLTLATCPGGVPRPCPEGISADDPGYMVVNYRNEPIGLRIYDPTKLGPDGKPGMQADGLAGDLAFALQSRVDRKIPELNVQPGAGTNIKGTLFPPPINSADVGPGDPFTPMVRTFFGDRVRVKAQAGAHEETHNVTIHGVKWLQGGSGHGFSPGSGWRNAQEAGISEQFTFASPALPLLNGGNRADHLYSIDASEDGFWNGTWGIVRMYGKDRADLFKLPNTTPAITLTNASSFSGVCPKTAPVRSYGVTAILANDLLPNYTGATIVPADSSQKMHVGGPLKATGGTLVYNPRGTALANGKTGVLHDPTAILLVNSADLVRSGNKLSLRDPAAPVEPVVLRAAAGECIDVTVQNALPALAPDLGGYRVLPGIVTRDANGAQGTTAFQNNLIRPSSYVGLHAGLVAYDVTKDDGVMVGTNPITASVVPPGGGMKYRFYAGDLSLVPQGGANFAVVATPVEFGGIALSSADKIKQPQKGLVGAMVVLPQGSRWTETDTNVDHQRDTLQGFLRKTRASATVTKADGTVVRDFAAVYQRGVNQKYKDGTPVSDVAAEGVVSEDSEESGAGAINYGSEPMWLRFGLAPNAPFGHAANADAGAGPGPGYGDVPNAHEAYSNAITSGTDPVTPVFTASAGQELRLHVLEPAGAARGGVFTLHGHVWQRTPYVCPGSAYLGLAGNCNPTSFYPTLAGFEVGSRAIGHSPTSMYLGGQESILPGAHFDIVAPAGGANGVPGDYLFRDQAAFGNTLGLWGIVRVR
jgi:hypothetical protein